MRHQQVVLAIAGGLLIFAWPAFADHNRKNGEEWANMPNDIHNTRVETRENDDNEAFRDLVRFGEGSKSVNRFDTDDTQPNQVAKKIGNGGNEQEQSRSAGMKMDGAATRTASKDRVRSDTRSRLESAANSLRTNRNAISTRSTSGRRSGGKR